MRRCADVRPCRPPRRLATLLGATVAASAGAAITREQTVALGSEAHEYGLPLLEFLRVRREMTSVRAPDGRTNAPLNVFGNARGFAGPRDRTVVAPNVDTLYSIAHLDLGRGPVVTVYDADGFLVANPARRYAVGDSHAPLVRRADGSIVVALQRDRPAQRDVNWLPTPAGGFRLSLRLYRPERSILRGAWTPPVRRLAAGAG